MSNRNNKSRGDNSRNETATYRNFLPQTLTQELRRFCNHQAYHISTVLLAAFKVLLFRFAFPETIAVAVPNSSEKEGFKKVITEPSGDMTFDALLDQTESSLASALELEPGATEHACQALFQFGGEVGDEPISFSFALFLKIQEADAGFGCLWRYKGAPFDGDFVRGIAGCLSVLIEEVIARPDRHLNQISLLSANQKSRLRDLGLGPQNNFPDDKCIHQLFEIQAAQTPDQIAVQFENDYLTYSELNRRANRLARYFQNLGVKANGVVGVCLERSLALIVTLLGVLKAGGAYLPLDPAYPKARLGFMLENARAPVLVTQASLEGLFTPGDDLRIVTIDEDRDQIARHDDDNLNVAADSRDLAYILYTSGSTGQPKGVACHHSGVVNLLADFENRQPLQASDNCGLWTVVGFDVSVYEIWSALLAGGRLHIAPDHIRSDPGLFLQWMAARQINSAYLPPFMLNALAERQAHDPLPLRRLLVGVEPIAESLLVDIQANTPGLRLINGYGPTETTICATLYTVPRQSDHTGPAPIGRPVQNTIVYVLDKFQHPTPLGVPGELYIGGAGVAHGYLNHPELTRERFVPNPMNPDMILYRTGDKVRYGSDGNLCFLGRFDHQVKLRGFRIELGEITNCLKTHPDIVDAVVVVRDDLKAGEGLVAYIVWDQNSTFRRSELEAFLAEHLPAYMIPNAFVPLSALPQTLQGKIDRRALPPSSSLADDKPLAAPCTPAEIQVAEIWSQILKIEFIGREENFFHLGGDSLRATQIIVRLNAALDIQLAPQILFKHPTIARLAKHIQGDHREKIPHASAHRDKLKEVLPLSYAQQGIWLFEQLHPEATVFHIANAYHIKGDLRVIILSRSMNAIIRRHEALRTVFTIVDDVPVQVIKPPFAFNLKCETIQYHQNTDGQTSVRTWIRKKACESFNLEKGPLIRAALLKVDNDEYIFSLTMHHIISDGWSVGVFIKELNALYSSHLRERPVALPEPPVQYAHFAVWQREQYQTNETRLLNYWKSQLKAPLPKLEWPVDHGVGQGPRTYNGARRTIKVDPAVSRQLKSVSRHAGATLFMTLLAIYKILLYQFTGQTELMVGTAVANRKATEFEPLIGLFMNPLIIRADISENALVSDFIENIKNVVLEAFAYDDAPYSKVAEVLQPTRGHDSFIQPLFLMQALFLMQTMDIPQIAFPDITAEPLPVDTGREYADLTLELYDTSEGITGWFEYSADLFDEDTIRRLADHFIKLIEEIAHSSERTIDSLPLIDSDILNIRKPPSVAPEKELTQKKKQLLAQWNNTQKKYPKHQGIHQLFEKQVQKTPDAVAIQFEGRSLTYTELNTQANQLAHYLRKSGVGADALVGICIPPSLELIVSLLGVLKANSVYAPLDPHYPTERIAFMVEDSGVRAILTLASLTYKSALHQTPLICIDRDKDIIQEQSVENPRLEELPNELAYVIYTSGSTGKPKGVCGTVRGVLNRLYWGWEKMPYQQNEVCCHKTSINFVDHVAEIFSPLLKGVSLIIIPDYLRADILELIHFLSVQKVTRLTLVPSLLKTILENAPPYPQLFRQLKYVICSGETLPLTLTKHFHQRVGSARLINLYGSSEVAADVTYFEVNWTLTDTERINLIKDVKNISVPIGKPIANTQIYILDKDGDLLPPGTIGEIYVCGDGLAQGYLNQPELTRQAFVRNPFVNNTGSHDTGEEARMFKTGDLACWLPDGNLEFHGRTDHQIKMRGFRIELGEIEAVMRQHEAVGEAVVLLHEADGNQFLCAYLTQAEGRRTDHNSFISKLREWLEKRLPDYMVPSSFTVMNTMPLNPNGKIDRGALPDPMAVDEERKRSYTAPRDDLEHQVILIWESVLKIKPIGVNDNFFELGGNSLAAVIVLNKIGKAFKRRLPPVTLYQAPSVAQLASVLRKQTYKIKWKMIEPIQIHGSRPPFFFFGSIDRAKALAPLLGADQPFFRINVLGFRHEAHSSVQLSDIAQQACAEIRMLQPQGPYFFGAFCNNAVLAVEIAYLINEDNRRVAFMGVFDLFWEGKSYGLDIDRHYHNLLNFGFKHLVEKIRVKSQRYQERCFINWIKWKAALNRHLGKPAPPKLADIELFEKINATFNKSAFKLFRGRITHFMASEWRISHSPFLDKIASNGVEAHIINGCHDNLFFKPQVIQMAQKLKVCLDREQSGNSQTKVD